MRKVTYECDIKGCGNTDPTMPFLRILLPGKEHIGEVRLHLCDTHLIELGVPVHDMRLWPRRGRPKGRRSA